VIELIQWVSDHRQVVMPVLAFGALTAVVRELRSLVIDTVNDIKINFIGSAANRRLVDREDGEDFAGLGRS